jgi:predicted RNase H-like HicB family nuclease
MESHQKFLEFKGKVISFLNKDGGYWISLPSLCEALNIDANRYYKNAKKDPILGPALAIQPVQVSKNGNSQLRNVTCIPEYLVYGWLFSVKSESPELIEYKKTCYELLYNHFHGTITNRKELLLKRKNLDEAIFEVKQSLKEEDEKYKRLQELQNRRKTISTQLNSIDKELINQPELFDEK